MPQTGSVTLSPEEATRYRVWLEDAFGKAKAYLGTEVEDFLDPLLEMEAFIESRQNGPSTLDLERSFARAAGYAATEPAGINDILGLASESFNRRMSAQGSDVENMLALLQRAGAMVVRGGRDFIPTISRPLPERREGLHPFRQVMQPRLSWLVTGLRTIGIYPEDLVLHVRDKDPGKLKAAPHLLIEIPRLKKQIALCQQKGEVTFVADARYELEMWEKCNKYQLKTLPGVTPVILRDKDQWVHRILSLLQGSGIKPGPKIDLVRDAHAPGRKTMPYTVEMIVESLKASRDPQTGAYPNSATGVIQYGPLANGVRAWYSIDSAIYNIWGENNPPPSRNGLTRENCPYPSLSALKNAYGLNIANDYTVAMIVESLKASRDPQTRAYPNQNTGVIQHGPLANGVRTWCSVSLAMQRIWGKNPLPSCNSLTRENCPHRSLAALKDAHGLNDDYTVEMIVETLKACCDPQTGAYSHDATGVIEHGPLANGVRTWCSVNRAMRIIWRKNNPPPSSNGLTRENCPYDSLAVLKKAHGLVPQASISPVPGPS